MTPAEIETLIVQLTAYAAADIRLRTRWITRGVLPEGHDAGSIANEAIARVLQGARRWDPEAEPDLLRYLKSVVKSIVWDLMQGAGKEALEPPDEGDERAIEEVPTGNPGPDVEVVAAETADRMFAALETDEERIVFLCIRGGNEKAAGIAQELGLDAREVYRIKQKIRRRLFHLKEED
jgi:RNA polymerase sigma factor (sigma-70 family)